MLNQEHTDRIIAELDELRGRVGGTPSVEVKVAVSELEEHARRLAHTDPTDPTKVTQAPGLEVDPAKVILFAGVQADAVEVVRDGEDSGKVIAATLSGRINHTDTDVRVTFLMASDGAALVVAELIALAHRIDPFAADKLMADVRAAIERSLEVGP